MRAFTRSDPARQTAPALLAATAVTVGALLCPTLAPAESSLQSGSRTASTGASAHLDFRIVIPPVLGLTVNDSAELSGEAANVAIFSNTQHVMLSATHAAGSETVEARPAENRYQLLRAERGRVIRENTACRVADPKVLSPHSHGTGVQVLDTRPVLCTVAMP
jgi:hypothetical protein